MAWIRQLCGSWTGICFCFCQGQMSLLHCEESQSLSKRRRPSSGCGRVAMLSTSMDSGSRMSSPFTNDWEVYGQDRLWTVSDSWASACAALYSKAGLLRRYFGNCTLITASRRRWIPRQAASSVLRKLYPDHSVPNMNVFGGIKKAAAGLKPKW